MALQPRDYYITLEYDAPYTDSDYIVRPPPGPVSSTPGTFSPTSSLNRQSHGAHRDDDCDKRPRQSVEETQTHTTKSISARLQKAADFILLRHERHRVSPLQGSTTIAQAADHASSRDS